jgi:hypothetical protein
MTLLTPDEVFNAASVLLARHPRLQAPQRGWSWLSFRRERRKTG